MNNKVIYFLICTVFCVSGVNAQTVTTGRESKKTTINFMEVANYCKEHPLPFTRKPVFEEDEEERPKHGLTDPSMVHLYIPSNSSLTPHTSLMPTTLGPVDTFESTVSDLSGIPPDTHGAVDSYYCVTAINTAIHIQTRSGANVTNVSLDGFWSAAGILPAGTGAFDPRVHYDPFNRRWILVTDAVNNTTFGQSTIMVGVSVTNNPTGSWHLYSVSVDATGATWLDFPCVGYNNKWIAVSGNMFGGSAGGAVMYVFDYASIMAGAGAPFTKFTQPSSFTISPVLTYDPTQDTLFAVEDWSNTAGQLNLWRITGPVGTPTMTSVGLPTTTRRWRSQGPGGGADFTPQVGTTNKMQAGDDRITSSVYRNHKIWCAHTVFMTATGGSTGTANRCSIMWWQINTNATVVQNGLIDDPSHTTFYDYPSIAVNSIDDALIGFGYFKSTIHPSAGYALHLHTDPTDSMRPAFVFRHGLATYYETFGGTQDRWGDYSGTCVDPRNDTDFWTIQESTIVGTSPNWDTWWAKIQYCPKPLAPSMALTPTAPCEGVSVTQTYAINPIPGATYYVWTVAGTGWSGSSSTDSCAITSGTGTGTVSVVAYNSCGEGESRTFTIVPLPLPHLPVVSTYSAACIGLPTATFSATSTGATGFSWTAYGTGWSGTSSASSLTANVGTGVGTIVCTPHNACGNGPSDTLMVTPAVVPTSNFSVQLHVTNVLNNDTVTFTGSAPAGCTYNWNFGGGTGVPGTGPGPQIVTWSVAGNKTITLTVVNAGCASSVTSDTVHVINTIGVKEVKEVLNDVTIVPNPNNGAFEIEFSRVVNSRIIVKIIDMLGKTVYNNQFGSTSDNKLLISTNNLPVGNYTATINFEGNTFTKHITLAR